jgi:hypothetical protein
MGERRRLHVGAFLGLSATAYAVTLAAVTALQAGSEAAIVVERGPIADAIARIARAHDSLDADARRASAAYERTTGTYQRASETLGDVEARLAGLAKVVGALDGAVRSLPNHVALPRITPTVTTVRPTTVHATTGGSGG